MIHKEGFLFLFYSFMIILLLIFISLSIFSIVTSCCITTLLIIFYIFLISFFRNPKRYFYDKNPSSKEMVISPADGKIVKIKNVFEPEFLKKNCICISIFMSPLNVHVNRFPVSGKIIYTKYYPGKHFLAWVDKSSLKNERTTVVIETNKGKRILLRQIAGFLARRIILYAKKNSLAKRGEEFGFIKFGSRVDIFLPLNSSLLVKEGAKVYGGETKISILPSS
ncbi:phosphatidylserine decarboxylase family protein [Blattabacterium cuenoti]|uniref:phosphatidylserine decarboxylase family protein n=1 Tax=Blattabacterium cuenoti TaxID=1653831 RepID=UPI00163C9615|nr:phosphatidylserine decarboxylase family protein [Blattabacterium cuenoti]